MTTFNDRENAFESKFAHDSEMQFRAEARRNKLLGLWAAGLLGKSGADADAYAMEVVMADMAEAGSEDVVAKVAKDLGAHSSADAVRAKLVALLPEAKAQLMSELAFKRIFAVVERGHAMALGCRLLSQSICPPQGPTARPPPHFPPDERGTGRSVLPQGGPWRIAPSKGSAPKVPLKACGAP